jgi:TetR/AcrR family transcriptional regulator, cholesterol catabolism regulator
MTPDASTPTPSPPPTPREAILDTATRLFGAQGYTGTTMRDIAKAVGILPGSLYIHIDSKETLLLEVVEAAFERFMLLADELEASTEPPDVRMRIAIEQHVRAVGDSRERTLVVLHQWRFLTGEHYDRIVGFRRRYARAFIDIIDDGIADGVFSGEISSRDAAFAILGVLNWVPEWYSEDGPETAEELGVKLADTLLDGLLTRDSVRR